MPAQTRRNGWILALGLTMSLIAPSLAEAQQGGLFPNIGVRRQRVPCAAEDPVYKLYRHEYFGYHPTCWRRFPAGWGCPSPEAPNPAEAFKAFPRDKPPALDSEEGDDAGPANGGGMNEKPATPNPNDLPLPDGDASPFELDNKPKPKPVDATTPGSPTTRRQPASAIDGLASSAAPMQPTNARTPALVEEPLLSLPEPPDPTVSGGRPAAPSPVPSLPGTGSLSDADPSAYVPQAKPAKRQTLLSNLFGGLGSRRR